MKDAGFILASYVVTFGSVACFALLVLRRSKKIGRDVPREDRPWS